MSAVREDELRQLNPETEDKLLAIAFKDGDDSAYTRIYEKHLARVERVCRKMLRQPDDVKEASQETFLRVYKALPRFNGQYQLGAWIARIATNVCLDSLRSQTRRPSDLCPAEELELISEETIDYDNPEILALRRVEGRRINRILDELPPLHRAAIVLRDIEGLSYEEIALALDLSATQTKALIHRARKSFKRSWAESLASILVPWRLASKFRHVEAAPKEQTAQVLSSGGQIAAQCSAAIQQCGAVVMERLGNVMTAAVVGTAAVGTAAVIPSVMPVTRTAPVAASLVEERAIESEVAGMRLRTKKPKEISESSSGSGPAVTQEPVVEPSPAPTTPPPSEGSQPPSSSEGSGGGGISGGQPTGPSPSPTPTPQEPTGFSGAVTLGISEAIDSCTGCLRSTQVISASGRSEGNTLSSYKQVLSANVHVGGAAVYGSEISHSSDGMSSHSFNARVWTSEGSYDLGGSGGLTSSVSTAWGGTTYTFTGTYTRGSGPSDKTSLPKSGTYTIEITFSHTQQRIVSTNISL